MDEAAALAELRAKLSDRTWRLNNLYKIKDKDGNVVQFVMNRAQRRLLRRLHHRNCLLKARQLGFSTFVQLYMLDVCLFRANQSAGIVAHNREAAEDIFTSKIKFAFDNLPEALRAELAPTQDSVRSLTFSNGSRIVVGTSLRSGTFQMLHVSEYGKIAAAYPARAREVKTGTFEAVPRGGLIFVESTAEGNEGEFYDLVQESRKLADAGRDALDPLQFKFHFFSWHEQREYVADPKSAVISARLQTYFKDLELKHGVRLTDAQRAWYALKEGTLGEELMRREYPSHPDEAFEATIHGAYYTQQIRWLRQNQRITTVPHNPELPVITAWDLGVGDDNPIWFAQVLGREVRLIDFYQNNGEGLEYYANLLREWAQEKGYRYERHFAPHDIETRGRWVTKTGLEVAAEHGLHFTVVPAVQKNSTLHAIEPVRQFLPLCVFDEERCGEGIRALENYRREWDERRGCYRDQPMHNWASHASKAFEVLARANIFGDGPSTTRSRAVRRRPIAT